MKMKTNNNHVESVKVLQGKISLRTQQLLFIVIYIAIDSTIMVESLSRYATNLLASLFLRMQSIFGGGESLTSDLTFCMKGRECNNTPSQQNICCSLSIPSFVFIYYYFIYVSREILMKGTKKPRMFVFIYVCGVCVSVYVCIIYI